MFGFWLFYFFILLFMQHVFIVNSLVNTCVCVCIHVCVHVLQTGGWGWTVHRHCVSTVDRNVSLQSCSRATLQTQHGIGRQNISLNYFSTVYIHNGFNTTLRALPQRVSPFPHTEIIVLFTLLLRKLTWCFLIPWDCIATPCHDSFLSLNTSMLDAFVQLFSCHVWLSNKWFWSVADVLRVVEQ